MPIPEDLRQQIEELMNAEDDDMIRRTVLGTQYSRSRGDVGELILTCLDRKHGPDSSGG